MEVESSSASAKKPVGSLLPILRVLPAKLLYPRSSPLFPRRHRLRWHSFQSSHRPSLNSVSLQTSCQSVAQMNLLQKYSLLKLTALLEKHTPSNKHGFSW